MVRDFPLAPNRANLTLRTLADVYMANFAGRDFSRGYTVEFWVRELGDRRLIDIDADAIADVLDRLAASPVTKHDPRRRLGEPADQKSAIAQVGVPRRVNLAHLQGYSSGGCGLAGVTWRAT